MISRCFPYGKLKALTMSYDDGRHCDKKLIDIFNRYNIKGTFHLNSGTIDNEESKKYDKYGKRIRLSEINKIYKGHEVACHTVNHIPLTEYSKAELLNEIIENRKALEKEVKYPVRGMSYPYGSFNQDTKNILKTAGIEYSRTVNDTYSFEMPKDFLEWNGTCRNIDDKLLEYGEKFLNYNTKRGLALMYVWGHSYEFARDNSWDKIEKFCALIADKEDIWYATNIEIVDYLNAWKNLKYSMDGSFVYNPSYISVWVREKGNIYEIKGGQTLYLEDINL